MLFLYRQVQNNDDLRMYATVGLESPDGLDGLQLTYDNIVRRRAWRRCSRAWPCA